MLNTIGEIYFRLHQSKWFTLSIIGLLLVCVVLIAGARPAETQRLYDVSPFQPSSNISTLMDRYVQVTGKLDRSNVYQVKSTVVGIQVRGTHFVPMLIDGRTEPVMILDQDLPPATTTGDVQVTGVLRGRPEGADQYPAYYLEPDKPANIPLNNVLAQIAISLSALALLLVLGGWLAKRVDYALDARETAMAYKGPLLWFGSLGSRFINAIARQQPVSSSTVTKAIQLDSQTSGQPWSVVIQRVVAANRTGIATTYGGLPALRIRFEDERGLMRSGVIAGSDNAISQLSAQLERIGAK